MNEVTQLFVHEADMNPPHNDHLYLYILFFLFITLSRWFDITWGNRAGHRVCALPAGGHSTGLGQ